MLLIVSPLGTQQRKVFNISVTQEMGQEGASVPWWDMVRQAGSSSRLKK